MGGVRALQFVQELLHAGIHSCGVNFPSFRTPLIKAIRMQDRQMVQTLLDSGVNPNVPGNGRKREDPLSPEWVTPLMMAVQPGSNDVGILALLLGFDARIICHLDAGGNLASVNPPSPFPLCCSSKEKI